MLIALRENNEDARAWLENKKSGPWFCPLCKESLILRKGEIRVDHFAHRPNSDCDWGRGESEKHRQCKIELYQSLVHIPAVSCIALERDLKTVRPDLSFLLHGQRVAIEVQVSELSMEKILHRTREYKKLDTAVLWLALIDAEAIEGNVSPPLWQKWVHALYFGRIYCWKPGYARLVRAAHLEPTEIEVPYSEWYSEGELHQGGGYTRRSKRWREICLGPLLDLSTDFGVSSRASFCGGRFEIPEARIFMDKSDRWWSR